MKRRRLIILTLIVFLCFPIYSFAETIVLKSRQAVEGSLIEKTDKYIKINFQGAPVTYFLEEVESIDGERVIQVNLQNNNNTIIEDKSVPKSYPNRDLEIRKEIEDFAFKFWSYRYSKFGLKLSLKYGDFAFIILWSIFTFLLTVFAVVLLTLIILKTIKYSVPFPVVLVFGFLIWKIVDYASLYFLLENTSQLIEQIMNKFSYAQLIVQSMMETRINFLATMPLEKTRINLILILIFYFSGGIYLLTLHKPSKTVALVLLVYSFLNTLRFYGFRSPLNGALFVPMLILFAAYICLDEKYFHK